MFNNRKLTFDDVCLVPCHNNVYSREIPDLSTKLTSNIDMNIPILASNMDSVINYGLAEILDRAGSIPIMHRFCSIEDRLEFQKGFSKSFISIGINNWYDEGRKLASSGHKFYVCIDVAQGHDSRVYDAISELREWGAEVIAGNVCTPQGYIDLVNAGATAVKVGIGPGAACTTRVVTGFGVPQLSALLDIRPYTHKYKVPIICDGGIRSSGDIVKALAAGASSVMIGKMFAATKESAAEKRGIGTYISTKYEARFKGQASPQYQREGMAAEGIEMWTPVIGSAVDLIDELCGGIRSGLTYAGSKSIAEFQEKVIKLDLMFEASPNYIQESRPRK